MMMEPTVPPAFANGEKVMVPHTDKFYEAKILKSEFRPDGLWYYFLHYTGWNKKYDEWVEETGLMRPTAEQMAMHAQPAPGAGMGAGAGPGSRVGPVAPVAATKGKKPSVTKDKFTVKKRALGEFGPEGSSVHLDCEMPPLLKKYLLDDYEAIVEEGRLPQLPRAPTVDELLRRYVQEALESRGNADSEEEVANGLRSYFDKALEAVLLYRAERVQAQQVLGTEGRLASSVYGAEHLLRLIVRLPDLLGAADTTAEQLAQVSVMVQDVMHWLQDHHQMLFVPKDRYMSPEMVVRLQGGPAAM